MIRFESVSKTYTALVTRRRVPALADFSMEMNAGEVIGIAGPNGAGKSTLISLVLGFLNPTGGRVTIDGKSPRTYVEHFGIGYLTELVTLPPTWKVAPALRRMAALSGVVAAELDARVSAIQTELGARRTRGQDGEAAVEGQLAAARPGAGVARRVRHCRAGRTDSRP
jgi:ABC-type multidrug transport system ATPase subunit